MQFSFSLLIHSGRAMRLLHHVQLATGLWVITLAVMIVATLGGGPDDTLFYWGVVASVASGTTTVVYFQRRNGRRIDAYMERVETAPAGEKSGPTHIAR